MGVKTYQYAIERPGIQVVAAVDKSTYLIGQDIGLLSDRPEAGVVIKYSLEDALADVDADIAVLTTVSDMERITPQIEEIVKLGLPVVTTCEELSYPWDEASELADRIDAVAIEHGVAVLGTGINPGFLMDALPGFLSGVCKSVNTIQVKRFQDAKFRRIPFQKKIGAGLTLEEFEAKKADGTLRHVGLTESMQFVASQLGWKLSKTEDIIEPVIAAERIQTDDLVIDQGMAAGVRQTGNGYVNGEVKIKLIFQAAVGEPASFDEVKIDGEPNIYSKIEGGVNGDIATCSIVLNALPSVIKAEPGLRTMSDIPMISRWE